MGKEEFECPICGYTGPFRDINPPSGRREHAQCPKCGSLERHRLQFLVARLILDNLNTPQMKMLHFAPEAFLRDFFSEKFGTYETADLNKAGVDHKVDLINLPFSDSTYDFVFASHVLEHIVDDQKALKEIRRVLKPNGLAFLPVPIVSESTIEYLEPNPLEFHHVRAPGLDYFDRYVPYFSRVELYRSDSLPERHQLFVYEDRSRWPTTECPQRRAMVGDRHIEIVPVCYA